ncbi:hypothetical protein BaRGS_00010919 [Batillaria attramentaria]|uniref:Peptidase S1 domain-containing protein n=1 Tax=Batillaria attramentaria TaxID=370345 RepID=A0ABD0LEL9_9CAEN
MATTLHLVVLATLLGQGYCNPAHWFRYVGDSLWRAKPPCKGAFSLQEDGKIVGGTAAEVGEFPFLVPIKYSNGNQFCGGSIINERFVLTAAHCVPDGDPTGLMITAGDYCTNIAEDSEYNIGVSRVILSDDWTAGGRSSLYPQKVDVDVVPLDTCRSQYAKETLYDSQICAASPGSDSCQGDSGGPLFNLNCDSKPVLVGVVSWGYGCADARYSGVYTRVSSYKDWINTNTV